MRYATLMASVSMLKCWHQVDHTSVNVSHPLFKHESLNSLVSYGTELCTNYTGYGYDVQYNTLLLVFF